MRTITVTNDRGRDFTVLVVLPGECMSNGLTGKFDRVNDTGKVVVEVFDATHAGRPTFYNVGQKVSEYYAGTLLATRGRMVGIDLHGGVAEWKVDGHAWNVVLNWVALESYRNCPVLGEWAPDDFDVTIAGLSRT